jgi:hypothetical protein
VLDVAGREETGLDGRHGLDPLVPTQPIGDVAQGRPHVDARGQESLELVEIGEAVRVFGPQPGEQGFGRALAGQLVEEPVRPLLRAEVGRQGVTQQLHERRGILACGGGGGAHEGADQLVGSEHGTLAVGHADLPAFGAASIVPRRTAAISRG